MGKFKLYTIAVCLILFNGTLFAEEFYLDNPRNEGMLRFEINNDTVVDEDSNFSNGWSFQYHTVRYATWDESRQPGFINWVGKHFPTLNDENSIVRNAHGIGQNIITPGDLTAKVPLPGDLPYAGTLTYTLNWQSFNRDKARNFQITAGVLGEEAFGEEIQKFAHRLLDETKPEGWDTQRDTEPILNLAYQHLWRLGHFGQYQDGWAGQFTMGPSASLGNLFTAVELGAAFRFGWNMFEGFNSFPAPPGRGFFTAYHIPKPATASPHGVEAVLGLRGTGLIFSVLYDGSFITDDDRDVEREDFIAAGFIGLNYHYYKLLSIRLGLNLTSDIIKEETIPDPGPGKDKTRNDSSFGTFQIDFYF